MSFRSALLASLLVAVAVGTAACGECSDGEGQCSGDVVQVCKEDHWEDLLDCSADGLSCVEACVSSQPCCR